MAEYPSLPLWTDALLADTGHLSDEEFGTYLRLLILTWRSPECKIPNDDDWIRRRYGCSENVYGGKVKPILDEFFSSNGNHLFQKRLKREFDYLRDQSKRNSDNAKSRWKKKKTPSEKDAGRTEAAYAPTPTPTPPSSTNVEARSEEEMRKQLFDHGKAVLGDKAGGIINKLLDHHGGDIAKTRATIEIASTKRQPRTWIMRIINGGGQTYQLPDWFDEGVHYVDDRGDVRLKSNDRKAMGPIGAA